MDKSTLNTYAELDEKDGISTLFRKFDTGTLIFQFKDGKHIGGVLLLSEHMDLIQNAPTIKSGDGKTKQTI